MFNLKLYEFPVYYKECKNLINSETIEVSILLYSFLFSLAIPSTTTMATPTITTTPDDCKPRGPENAMCLSNLQHLVHVQKVLQSTLMMKQHQQHLHNMFINLNNNKILNN